MSDPRPEVDPDGQLREGALRAPLWAFDDDRLDRPAIGALKKAEANGQKPPRRRSRTGLIRVADVESERVRWLWPGRIPRAKLTVLDGDPGLGKSTLTLDLAARVSTGSPLPTGDRPERPSSVLVLSAEDGVADTIRPRLEAAGADLARVLVLEEVPYEDEHGNTRMRPPVIPVDVAYMENVIIADQVALVVIDPLMAFLAAGVNSWRDQDVRRALHTLAAMAERTGAAILVLRHLSKSGGAHALYRGGGSIGIIGAARAGLLVAPDPEDEDRRILALTKSNLAAMPPALAFRLVPDELRDVARVAWEGQTEHRASDLLATFSEDEGEKGAIVEAVEFLEGLFVMGSVRAREAKRAAGNAGIASRTLDHARKRIGVTTRPEGFGPGATWWWDPPIDANSDIDARDNPPGENGESGDNGRPCHSCQAPTVFADDDDRPWCTDCEPA